MNKLTKISSVLLIASLLFVLIFSSISVSASQFIDDPVGAGSEAPTLPETPESSSQFINDPVGASSSSSYVNPIAGSETTADFINDPVGSDPAAPYVDPIAGDNNGNNGSDNSGADVTNYFGDVNSNNTTNYYNNNYDYDINIGDVYVNNDVVNNSSEAPETPEAPIVNNNNYYNDNDSTRYSSTYRSYRSYDDYDNYYNDYYDDYAYDYYDHDYPVTYRDYLPSTCETYIKDVIRLGNRVKFTVQNPITNETIAVFSVDI
jgi:hypothetical protein